MTFDWLTKGWGQVGRDTFEILICIGIIVVPVLILFLGLIATIYSNWGFLVFLLFIPYVLYLKWFFYDER